MVETEHIDKSKNLGWPEIRISFEILILLCVICVWLELNMFGQVAYALPIWVFLSAIPILGPYVLSQIKGLRDKKGWKDVAEFGEKLWYFPNLWYVVFLVGLYVTVTDVAQRVIGPPAHFDVSILLIAARNLVLAVFLAVITSVLAHTFWELSESAGKIDKALQQLGTMTNKVKDLELKVSGAMATMDTLEAKVSGAINTLGAIAGLSVYSARVCELTRVAKEIASSNTDLGPFRDALVDLSHSIISYNKTALLPLFPPEIDTSSEDKNIFPDFIKSIQRNEKPRHRQHCAYMAVATGRYLEAEALDRSFPGILLNVTSFVYYAQTAERVVNALQAWPEDFHFYTLMPKSPAELFRFRNTIDLEQWLGFLENYNIFQREVLDKGRGKWIRYFAYAETSTDKCREDYDYTCRKELEDEIKKGYVKCEEASDWKPQVFSETDLKELIDSDIVEKDRDEAKIQNKIHGNRGTCVIVRHGIDRDRISSWTRLEDAIINLHADKDHFRYRSMKDIEDIFDKDITLDISSKRQCKIKLPRDIVAVRRASASIDAKPEDWILLIGLDEYFIGPKGSQMGLAFSPVLDLCSMAQSGTNNKKTVDEVRQYLQKIFLPGDRKGILTHSQFRRAYVDK